MSKTLVRIAIAYDFDGTLAPGNMQEHSFIPKLGINKAEFWKTSNARAKDQDMDDILAYMQLMLQKADEKHIPVTRRAFLDHGKDIRFFNGVESFFDRINHYAAEKDASIDHHIISSGIRDIIKGTSIAKNFKNIFASGFVFDANDVAIWPALAINYTNKTQYLFRINKGINNSYDNTLINKFVEHEKRPIPFSRMIYLGDGETDVPAMKMIKQEGGTAIAVYDPHRRKKKDKLSAKQTCEDLIIQKRADFIAPADYTENSKLYKIITVLINKIVEDERLKALK
ncbi:MAG: haloacid dehalogenase-like hydrolase [Bacteroidales bacterium]|nr:haloacid dehalogenase-like hydrolase [Bacteroidales bacterium]